MMDAGIAVASHAETLTGSIFASSAVGLLIFDRAGTILRASKGLCRLLGYREEELTGRNCSIFIHPEDLTAARLSVLSLMGETDPCRTVERRYLHKDGTAVWIAASVSRLTDSPLSGEFLYIAQITPIDRQKRAEAAAAEALERWSFALDSSRQGIWDVDLVTGQWFYSRAWRQMRGIVNDESLPATDAEWLAGIHPDDRDRMAKSTTRLHAGELLEIELEYREWHRDGYWMWVLARGRCLELTDEGKARRLIGTDTDITELKQREHEFADISNRFTLAIAASKIGIWEVDAATLKPVWDARTCEIFGCDPAQMANPALAWENRLHPEDRETALSIMNDALLSGEDYTSSYRIVRPDGETRHVRSSATIRLGADGRRKLVGLDLDVTVEVEQAHALEQANMLAENRNRELEAARAEMEHASLHDALTGLPNRRYLDAALSGFARSKRGSDGMVLLQIDLDRFKQINDTKGHVAGDAMLVHMADLLKSILGNDAFVARIGGDEFVVVLTPAPPRVRLEKLLDEILARSNVPVVWQRHEYRMSVSIGVAEARGDFDPRQLLVNGDIALYRAKRNGRKCAAYFSDELQAEIIAAKQCGDDILKGLERGEFVPHYQPQFFAATLEIAGVEALARWRHPTRGLLAPEAFMDVAVDLSAVSAIDRSILEQTLTDLAKWDAAGLAVPAASINVSAKRLGDKSLVASLKSLPIPPGRITFELLESIFLDEHDEVIAANIEALKQLGIDTAIDDFGTGYASIVSLLQVQPRFLKIDRQLVEPITEGRQQRRLVRSIIEIGKSQGVQVCAEGVESAAHVRILRDLGCDCMQGYFFGRAVPSEKIAEAVSGETWRGLIEA